MSCNKPDARCRGGLTFQRLLLVLLLPVVCALATPRSQAQTFADVPPGYWAFEFIETLAATGITSGCGGGNFCPEAAVTRAQMAVFLERSVRGSDFLPPPATGLVFLDVAAGSFAAGFIEQLFADGITSGCGGGNYCPANNVTRAQMAVFLLRARFGPGYAPPPASGLFADAPLGSFAVDWIEALAAQGISGGCGNGNFCPGDPVTRAQMAVFLVRTFDLVAPPGDLTAPTIAATVSPPPNAAGWNDGPVTVSFDCSDAESGIASCSAPVDVAGETVGQVVIGTAIDNAGNAAEASVVINIDTTAPSLAITSPLGNPLLPEAFIEGNASDALSGIASVECGAVAAAANGLIFNCVQDLPDGPQIVTVRATDLAGNETVTAVEFTLDSERPVVSISAPEDGALVLADQVELVATVTDGLGLAGVWLNGTPVTLDAGGVLTASVGLLEGSNVFTVSATDPAHNAASDSVTVVRDTNPPVVSVLLPADGAVIGSDLVDVSGAVNDIVPGVVNANDCVVVVNGITADVGNGTYIARAVPLQPGANDITAVATDAASNTASRTISVTQAALIGQRLEILSGGDQSGVAGSLLSQPLRVQLLDIDGVPVTDRSVRFSVTRGDGRVVDSGGAERRSLDVLADGTGVASAGFRLGSRAGAAADQVIVSAPGFIGEPRFAFSPTAAPATTLRIVSGKNQVAGVEQALLHPLVVAALDGGGNPVPGTAVLFEAAGRGRVDGQISVTRTTDSDGRASVEYNLGFGDEGLLGTVIARIEGAADPQAGTVVFSALPLAPGNGVTAFSGIVTDVSEVPLAGVTVSIRGTALATTTSAEGSFRLDNVPVGENELDVDGTTAMRGGPWPALSFHVNVVEGRNNRMEMPIVLPPIDAINGALAGGDSDVMVAMAGIPGLELTVFANSLSCPGGGTQCVVSISQVARDKVPMPPVEGASPGIVWTIQPAGAIFDPPARIRIPNVDQLPPGRVVDIFNFDHGFNEFVRVATGTVDENGAMIESDPGMGIRQAGWGHPVPPAMTPSCVADPFSLEDVSDGPLDGDPGGEDDAFRFDEDVVRYCEPGPCKDTGRFRRTLGRIWATLTNGRGTGFGCPEGNAVTGGRG